MTLDSNSALVALLITLPGLFTIMWWTSRARIINTTNNNTAPRPTPEKFTLLLISSKENLTLFTSWMCASEPWTEIGELLPITITILSMIIRVRATIAQHNSFKPFDQAILLSPARCPRSLRIAQTPGRCPQSHRLARTPARCPRSLRTARTPARCPRSPRLAQTLEWKRWTSYCLLWHKLHHSIKRHLPGWPPGSVCLHVGEQAGPAAQSWHNWENFLWAFRLVSFYESNPT